MTRIELAELRRSLIKERKAVLSKKVSALENKLYNAIFDKLISHLEASEGKIISNGKNVDLTTALDSIFKSFNQNEYLKVIQSFSKDLLSITDLNRKYFEVIEENSKKLQAITKQVKESVKARLGINSKGQLVKKGYLDKLINDPVLKQKVKKATYKAVVGGRPIEDFKQDMKILITGNEKINGIMQRHFNTYAYDTYTQIDRTTSKLYATKLGIKCGIYAGSVKATSRAFCAGGVDEKSGQRFEKKVGRVFTIDEMKGWKNDDFQGKPDDYDPLTDCGGHGCEHVIDWVSNSMAIRMRPELAWVLND